MEGLNNGPDYKFIVSSIQKINLYETKARFYLVGSNNTQTKFRVLKIDRTELRELKIVDDEIEYTQKEIKDLLMMIDVGNRSKPGQKGGTGLAKSVSAWGIVGFVRFMEGYYLIMITKRRRIASIGHHMIYKIEDISMTYIPNEAMYHAHQDEHKYEQRYVKMFQNVDLSSNFYFSYSYDLTHTLQFNMHVPCNFLNKGGNGEICKCLTENCESKWEENEANETNSVKAIAIRAKHNKKFAWNSYLLKCAEGVVHPDWLLYITHGFIGQSNISVFGRPIFLTLVARRSNRYAGTRFLKRGANSEGDVANEVETEQIVFDSSNMSLKTGRYTSYVQTRGSIPSHWSQDISKMVPKPPITLDIYEPYCYTAGLHFNQLLRRYGSPIIALNLVKKREKKKHESILSEIFTSTIEYLNQFIAEEHAIIHRSFDMARVNKAKEANVMPSLAKIAYKLVKKTGIFQNRLNFHCQKLRPHERWLGMRGFEHNGSIKQTGVVRVNCVDCLDRTNTAQFALGKVALAFQLYILGVLGKPELEFDSDAVRMLEELYEDHGDTLALQYGGSQLVHRIKTYRKTAPWTSQSRDIMQTLSRYYSNAFSDADKQNAINVFLGVFVPEENNNNLWELPTDYYLHHLPAAGKFPCHRRSYTQWWEPSVAKHLPLPYEEVIKCENEHVLEYVKTDDVKERLDSYVDFYRPFELSVLNELHQFIVTHSVRDTMPNFTTDFSPFSVRVRPGKRREEMGSKTGPSNPSLTGQSSTSSTTSNSTSSSADSSGNSTSTEDDTSDDTSIQDASFSDDIAPTYISFSTLLPSTMEVYGMKIQEPSKADVAMYKRCVEIGDGSFDSENNLIQLSAFSLDTSRCVTPPTVNKLNQEIYKQYLQKAERGVFVSSKDLLMYKQYVVSIFR